jgi:hypothetical protein
LASGSERVMVENRIAEYKLSFRAYRDLIICSMKVIGQIQVQGGVGKSL